MQSMREVLIKEGPRIIPYRPFMVGQSVSVFSNSLLREYTDTYFPESDNKARIVSIKSPHQYVVKMYGYNDPLEASHWHLRPRNLIETRLFAPIGLMAPGVMFKLIDTKEIKRIISFEKTETITDDLTRLNNLRMGVILIDKWERPILETYLRKDRR